MTPDQVPGFFDFGEGFIEGTIGAALVALWMLALALFLARPYMAANTHKFTLRLGADLWWMIYVALRDILLLQVFLGSFIFFYPDVVSGKELPITGGLAAVCAFSGAAHQARQGRPRAQLVPGAGAAARARGDALHRPVLPRRPGDQLRGRQRPREHPVVDARQQQQRRCRAVPVLPVGVPRRHPRRRSR